MRENHRSEPCLAGDQARRGGEKWKRGRRGRDGLPAEVFEIEVSAPDFDTVLQGESSVRKELVYDPARRKEVRHLYEELNDSVGGAFHGLPDWYREWKMAFQQMVYFRLSKICGRMP